MEPVAAVAGNISASDGPEMLAPEDEGAIEALTVQRPHESLRERAVTLRPGTEHLKLVAQKYDLISLASSEPKSKDDELEDPAQRLVEQRQDDEGDVSLASWAAEVTTPFGGTRFE